MFDHFNCSKDPGVISPTLSPLRRSAVRWSNHIFTCFLAKTRLIQTNIDCTSTIGKIFKRTLNNLMKIYLLDLSSVNALVVVEVQYLQQTNILQIPFIGPGLFLRGSSSRLWLLTSQPWFWWLRWLMAL